MEVLGHEYNPDQWHLFIDSSKVSLKVVLFHNRNRFPSVPLVHAVNLKEINESMKLLLGKIKYDEFEWTLCGDLKVVALTQNATWVHKILLFSVRVGQEESLNKLWPKRPSLMPGEKNVIPLLPEKIYLPPLHIKLGP